MDNLTKLRYRELIGEDEFVRQREELNREEITLKERLKELQTENWIEPSRNLFLFSNRAIFWLTHGSVTEKRLILSTVGSNLIMKAKKLSIDANEPFKILATRQSISSWCPREESNLDYKIRNLASYPLNDEGICGHLLNSHRILEAKEFFNGVEECLLVFHLF
jgi:hypothetical protein